MNRSVHFHRLAELELLEAAEYFDRKRPGLGTSFIDAVEACVAGIMEFPQAGARLEKGVRRRVVARFPYGVLYAVKPDQIRVLAVMHAKRRPMYWSDRK